MREAGCAQCGHETGPGATAGWVRFRCVALGAPDVGGERVTMVPGHSGAGAPSCGSSWARSCANTPSASRSSSWRVPLARSSAPPRALRMVDFPAPLGPRRMTRWPRPTARSTPRTIVCAPAACAMSAPSSASASTPHGGGLASCSLGGRRCVTIAACAASISGASLASAARAPAALERSTFSHLFTTSCSRWYSIFCFSTTATARRRRSSRTPPYLSNGVDTYSSSRPPSTSAI
eukprot:5688260-Prymnesium_polylepis.2